MASTSTKILDHLVHLTPPGTVDETAQFFRGLGFKVIPGGTHAGGLTANAIVVLADGVYLELIAFTHPATHYPPSSPERAARDAHPWAHKQPGWADFAHLGPPATAGIDVADIINARAAAEHSGAAYERAVRGGRARPDGAVLRWRTNAPAPAHGRGALPFFCGDDTPRAWRVPADPPANTVHPCAARGVAHVRVLVAEAGFAALARQLTSVVGVPPAQASATETAWALDTPNGEPGATPGPQLVLSVPRNEDEAEALRTRGAGVYEVALWVQSGQNGPVDSPFGRIVWRPLE